VAVSLFQLLHSAECCQFQHSTPCCTVQIHIQSAHSVHFRYTAGIYSVLLWMWQSVCSSYCSQLNAVSFSTALHAALYRSIHKGADKSLARTTSRCILFDGENISLDASLIVYIYINSTNIHPIMIINRIYEHQNFLSL
jgi:hypothetical protein